MPKGDNYLCLSLVRNKTSVCLHTLRNSNICGWLVFQQGYPSLPLSSKSITQWVFRTEASTIEFHSNIGRWSWSWRSWMKAVLTCISGEMWMDIWLDVIPSSTYGLSWPSRSVLLKPRLPFHFCPTPHDGGSWHYSHLFSDKIKTMHPLLELD